MIVIIHIGASVTFSPTLFRLSQNFFIDTVFSLLLVNVSWFSRAPVNRIIYLVSFIVITNGVFSSKNGALILLIKLFEDFIAKLLVHSNLHTSLLISNELVKLGAI